MRWWKWWKSKGFSVKWGWVIYSRKLSMAHIQALAERGDMWRDGKLVEKAKEFSKFGEKARTERSALEYLISWWSSYEGESTGQSSWKQCKGRVGGLEMQLALSLIAPPSKRSWQRRFEDRVDDKLYSYFSAPSASRWWIPSKECLVDRPKQPVVWASQPTKTKPKDRQHEEIWMSIPNI